MGAKRGERQEAHDPPREAAFLALVLIGRNGNAVRAGAKAAGFSFISGR